MHQASRRGRLRHLQRATIRGGHLVCGCRRGGQRYRTGGRKIRNKRPQRRVRFHHESAERFPAICSQHYQIAVTEVRGWLLETMEISDWRKQIDEIDPKLVELLNQRATAAREIGRIKRNLD